MSDVASNPGVANAIRDYFREFSKLKAASRDFWVVQLVNLLDGVAYFAMIPALILYLSENLGFGDRAAGNWYGVLMAAYTAVGFVAGFIGDALGIRRTLLISVIVLVVSRLMISAFTAQAVVIPALFLIMVGTAIMTPVLVAATKRYTTKQTRTAGFNLLYFLWNVGVIIAGPALDIARGTEYGNRGVFMMGSVLSILCWVTIMVLMRKRISLADDAWREEKASATAADSSEQPETDDEAESSEDRWENPLVIAWSVIRESAFWRFMLFLLIVVGVKLVFEHWHAISPKYYLRVIGPEAPVGTLNSLNGWVICIGLVISTPIVARFKLFNVMFVGMCISAASVLIPVIPPSLLFGTDPEAIVRGYYTLIVAQIIMFSIGEVIWSPRLFEYTAAIAPKNREASYMGLSTLPMFFARMVEGPLSGNLLDRYCPDTTTPEIAASLPFTQSPQFMWLILASISIATPILIVVFRGVIQKESRLEKTDTATGTDAPAT